MSPTHPALVPKVDESRKSPDSFEPSSTPDVFVVYDADHDRELYDRLASQSRAFGFRIVGRSQRSKGSSTPSEQARDQIRDADQVIVICGEHTDSSVGVHAELAFAQNEGTPHFLLWGRRELMCTKPLGAKPAEGMYSWVREVIRDQLALTQRHARSQETARSLRKVSGARVASEAAGEPATVEEPCSPASSGSEDKERESDR